MAAATFELIAGWLYGSMVERLPCAAAVDLLVASDRFLISDLFK